MKSSHIVLVAVTALALAGCTEGREKEEFGTILGGIGGAAIGSQIGGGSGRIIAAAAGTLLGAFAGRELGKSLDKDDAAAAQKAQNTAHTAPIGQQITWSNPETGHTGTVTPTRQGTDQSGNQCREYQSTVTIGGKTEQAYGTACRQADGSWKVVN